MRGGFTAAVLGICACAVVRGQDETALARIRNEFASIEKARGVARPAFAAGTCTKCHLGIDNPAYRVKIEPQKSGEPIYTFADPAIQKRLEELVVPARLRRMTKALMAHPNLHVVGGANSPHPAASFDCMDCHRGDLRAGEDLTDDQRAAWTRTYVKFHEDVPGEIEPLSLVMISTRLAQASCQSCHGTQARVLDGAEKYATGARLVTAESCYACHRMDDHAVLESHRARVPDALHHGRRPGPPLTHLADKFDKAWAFNFIKDPESFRPATRMPRFFGRGDDKPAMLKARVSLAEKDVAAAAITEYLFSLGKTRVLAQAPLISTALTQPFLEEVPSAMTARGELVVRQVGCVACHRLDESYGDALVAGRYNRHLQEFGPSLAGSADKFDSPRGRAWLTAWLKNPKHLYAETRMPGMALSDDEIGCVVEYLTSMRSDVAGRGAAFVAMKGKGAPPWMPVAPPLSITEGVAVLPAAQEERVNSLFNLYLKAGADAAIALPPAQKILRLGERLVEEFGCYSCHEVDDPARAQAWMATEPTGKPWTWRIFPDRGEFKRMPFPAASPEEGEALVTYLMGDATTEWARAKRPIPKPVAGTRERARGVRVLEERNCLACHEVSAQKLLLEAGAKPSWCEGVVKASDADGRMYVHWLADPRSMKLNDAQLRSSSVPSREVLAMKPRAGARSIEEFGGLKWQKTDQVGLRYDERHQLEARMPPSLRAEGSRAKSDWLRAYLKDPYTIRPLLRTREVTVGERTVEEFNLRMPRFGLGDVELDALAGYFRATGSPEEDAPMPDAQSRRAELLPAHQEIVATCTKCHEPGKDGWAPDLRRIGQRLRPAWIASYLRDPLLHESCSLMPAYNLKDEAAQRRLVDALRIYGELERR